MSYQLTSNAMPSKILYLDSRDANLFLATNSNGDDLTSYFQYVLTENIEIPLNQRALISLNSATIPYSFYNVRTDINDVIPIKLENITDGTIIEKNLVLENGNYTAFSLATEIETKFNATGGDFQDDTKGLATTLTIDFDNVAQKFVFRFSIIDAGASVGKTLKLTLEFTKTGITSPHIELGFTTKSDVVFDIVPPANFVDKKSINVIDVNGSIHGVYIRTNLVSKGTLDTQSGSFSNILSRIPINVQAGGILFATPNNATHRSLVDLRSINTITIRLTDERNRILDLNGLNFQIAIAIDFIYSKKPIYIPQGGASQQKFGGSFHDTDKFEQAQNRLINQLRDRNSKIKNKTKNK